MDDRQSLHQSGEGFAGKSFGGLETETTPQLLHDIDNVFPGLWVWWMFPSISSVLQYSPFKSIRQFLSAPERFKKVRDMFLRLPPDNRSIVNLFLGSNRYFVQLSSQFIVLC